MRAAFRAFFFSAFLLVASSPLFAKTAVIYSGLGDFAGMAVSALANDLRACGANVYVFNHTIAAGSLGVVNSAKGEVVLIGHSMGGNAAVMVAGMTKRHIAAVMTLDPNRFVGHIPKNVGYAINLYQTTEIMGGGRTPGAQQASLAGVGHLGFVFDQRVRARARSIVCR